MGKILLLPDEVASQVAAGEVVERPASVVKELVENSLDAGATQIEIAIRRGGASAIRVLDNGIGMDRDDALLSLERHATSKIRSGQDLARIQTLGFRGEALPSIASVSRFRLATRLRDALEGTEILVSGGKLETVRAAGEAPGTLIEARSLFYNLPARRKFLRSENTEASHIQHQLHLQAIGHPQVGFVYQRDQALVFHAPPARNLADRIRDLRGEQLLDSLLPIEPVTFSGIQLTGLIGRAGVSRSTRVEQVIFVNGRPVENSTIHLGLREGYHTALMRGQYPVTFLFVEMSPASVDVNVHPAKREVRFREPGQVREAVSRMVRQTLEADRSRWSHQLAAPPPEPAVRAAVQIPSPETAPLIPPAEQHALRRDWSGLTTWPEQAAVAPATPQPTKSEPVVVVAANVPDLRLVGILGKLYVLLESGEGLVLLDQHAAHERILFERLRQQMESEGAASQRLLIPLSLQVNPKDYDWVSNHLPVLRKMGFLLDPFGNCTLKVDGVPPFFSMEDPALGLRKLVDELASLTTGTSHLRMGEEMIAKTVCRHAIKANDSLHPPEVQQLVTDLLACELPYCCPHGRPTMIQVNYQEIEKRFGRRT